MDSINIFCALCAKDVILDLTESLIRLFHLLQKMGGNLIDMRREQSLIFIGVVYEYSGLRKQKKVA